jgi:hypothetical protein
MVTAKKEPNSMHFEDLWAKKPTSRTTLQKNHCIITLREFIVLFGRLENA